MGSIGVTSSTLPSTRNVDNKVQLRGLLHNKVVIDIGLLLIVSLLGEEGALLSMQCSLSGLGCTECTDLYVYAIVSPVYISHAGLQPLLPLSLHLRADGGCRSAGVGVEGGLGWGPTTFHGSEF